MSSHPNNEPENLPEIGGILHLDHVNFQVPEHDLATIFFINCLGLTRDPYRRADETNMGINVGLQQFHLPRRGPTPPFPGVVGLVVPDFATIRARLGRFDGFSGTPYTADFGDVTAEITSPFGFRLRLHTAGSVPFQRPLGIPYVEIFVPPGTATAIAGFYGDVFRALTRIESIDGETAAIISAGPFQELRFIERELDSYDTENFHISFHVTHYNEVRDRVTASGSMMGEALGQVFFFSRLFDPKTDATVLPLINEVRSVYHQDFMRPLVNRWPIVEEPFSDQAEVLADLAREVGFTPGKQP